MKALVYRAPHKLAWGDAPEPAPGAGETLLKVEAVGVCGSDMHAYHGRDERRPPPLILGHEAAGTIAAGPDAGRRATVNPLVACGACAFCRDGRDNLCPSRQILSLPPREGAFAEYLAVPARNLVPVPNDVPLAKAALAEPLACGWHAVDRAETALPRPLAASSCLVVGGGAIGLGVALVLAGRGAAAIWLAEPNPKRHATLERAGPFKVHRPGRDQGPPVGTIDLVIDAYGGAASRAEACRLVKPGGVIVHVGLADNDGGFDARRATLQEITFIGTYTYSALDFAETAAAIFAGRLGPLDWFEERPLEEGAAAFAAIDAGDVAAAKIVLRP